MAYQAQERLCGHIDPEFFRYAVIGKEMGFDATQDQRGRRFAELVEEALTAGRSQDDGHEFALIAQVIEEMGKEVTEILRVFFGKVMTRLLGQRVREDVMERIG